jgi:hypothetical protein
MADIADALNGFIIFWEDREFNMAIGRERTLRDRDNPLEHLMPHECKAKYRFYPDSIAYIATVLRPALERPTKRSNAMSPIYQVLLGLKFLGTGSYYETVGDTLKSCKTAVHNAVHDFVDAVCEITATEIVFPSKAALPKIWETFYQIGGIPRVCGLIDGTLIEIRKPKNNTADYCK